MRTTMKGLYALRAMITLASTSSPESPVAIKKIAEKEDISSEFLQQIFHKLRKAGIIGAVRGPGGGFYLEKPVESILVSDVLAASGEGLSIGSCSKGKERQSKSDCPRNGGKKENVERAECKACGFWSGMESVIKDFASSRTLADLLE
ncbi:MAG: Rrf2 family transcriptional regulator [Rectinemataceae bacterium]